MAESRKQAKARSQIDAPNLAIPKAPQWETRAKRPLSGGRLPGIDGSLWLWRAVPMSSVTDAVSIRDGLNVGVPLAQAYEELAAMARTAPRRSMAKGSYRQTQALLVNIPAVFEANPDSPLRDYLNTQFAGMETMRRILLFGVRLRSTVGNGGWKAALASVAETVQYGGAPLSDYDKDYQAVDAALSRCGFSVPDKQALHLADSWWDLGRSSAIPVTPHEEHIHFFHTSASARRAQKIDPIDCTSWTPDISHSAISFAAVADFDLRYAAASESIAQWVVPLLDAGARVISIRALVEPASNTRNVLRSQKEQYGRDLNERMEQGKMSRAELEEREAELSSVEAAYARGGPATLFDTSVVVGFDGAVEDIQSLAPQGLELSGMLNRQAAAWHETMLCSAVRANPMLHDLPASAVAYSALPTLSKVGDRDGAFLGLTERDRQPSYVSSTAASEGDTLPLFTTLGATGSGKSLLMQLLVDQWRRERRPQLVINPKQDSSLVDGIDADQQISFSDFATSNGGLDPLLIIEGRADAVTKAVSMIAAVNPYGPRLGEVMTDLSYAINFGAERGARGTGEALRIALDAGEATEELVRPVFRFAEVFPMFRATFGMGEEAHNVKMSEGTTLVEVGDTAFDLPKPGWNGDPSTLESPTQRLSVNIIRMLLWGGMSALRGRGGVIHMDESWVVEKAAPGDLDQVGRLARQWNVLPSLYSQRATGQLEAGLKGYISRGLIGHIKDETEARAALSIFGLEGNKKMLDRITAPESLSGGAGLNWDSLRPLRDDTGAVVRGAVFYHIDLKGRVAPVEVRVPPEMLLRMSTNPEDIRRRREAQARAAAVSAAPFHDFDDLPPRR